MLIAAVFWLLPLLLVVLTGLLGLRLGRERFVGAQRVIDSPYAAVAIGVATMLVIWYLWGSLNAVPVVHDEASYLLQAQTFARGHWAMPSPPLPVFFEQFHVFVAPTFASKYPPGHGILLVPGVWAGLPGLVPLLLNGFAGALLFVLVRRVTNGWIALLTILLWLPMHSNLLFRPSYFSENSTSVLWLAGWLALLEWRSSGRERWLLGLAACIGWMAITRPLTAVAFASPIAIVVLWQIARTRSWRTLVRPALLGVAILALLPLWSVRTIGTWRETPYSLYSKLYFPFDAMGFGMDTTPPERALPQPMPNFVKGFGPVHAAHTVKRLPVIFYERWSVMFMDAFRGARLPLAVFAVLGLIGLPIAGWFAVASSLLLTLSYLAFAHPAGWDLYYLEILPLLPFLTACGIWVVWRAVTGRGEAAPRTQLDVVTPQLALAALTFALLLLIPARADVVRMARIQRGRRAFQANFVDATSKLREAHTMVFIRYAPWHSFNVSLIANAADLNDARTWFVHDLGIRDTALIARAPRRVPYLYDEQSQTLRRVTPALLVQAAARDTTMTNVVPAGEPRR